VEIVEATNMRLLRSRSLDAALSGQLKRAQSARNFNHNHD